MIVRETHPAPLVLTAAVFLALLMWLIVPVAIADGGDTGAEISDLQKRVEQTARDYDKASAKVDQINKRIKSNDDAIAEIKRELPAQKKRAADAMEAMYKMQNQTSGLFMVIFSIDSLDSLLKTSDYLNTIQDRNINAIEDLKKSQAALKEISKELDADKKEAVKEKAAAKKAAEDAIDAREEAQQLAHRLSAEAAAAKAAQRAASKNGTHGKPSSAGGGGTVSYPGDAIDWSIGKKKFIKMWTGRIDRYLAGSPLAGQGAAFAKAAWTYGVDPRWSPAIAYTESGLGAHCFKPYNAWGWGSASWSNWGEAIDAHVSGLAHGYGSTISIAAAQSYCPPNWQNWYDKTLAQMNLI